MLLRYNFCLSLLSTVLYGKRLPSSSERSEERIETRASIRLLAESTQPPKQPIENKIDIATFFSPSSVRNFLEILGVETVQHALIAVIGPTTAEAVKEAGLEVNIVAKQQTAESLVHGIVEHFGGL